MVIFTCAQKSEAYDEKRRPGWSKRFWEGSIMRTITFPLVCVSLAGCLATADLKTSQGISDADRQVAQRIAELTSDRCVRYQYVDGPVDKKISGDMAMKALGAVKRLYRSDAGWYKAEVATEGIWDNVYYKPNQFFVCGEKLWQDRVESKSVSFSEVVPK
jgi:hypothetical protein